MAPRLERFEPRHPVPLNVHMQKSLSVGPRRLGEVLLIRQIKRVIIASFPVLFLLAWPRVSFTFFAHGLTFSGSSPRHYAIVSLHLRPSELFAFLMVRHSAVRSRGTRFVDLTEIQASAIVGLHWPFPANFLLSFRVYEWRSMLQSCSLRVCGISMGLTIRRTTTLTHITIYRGGGQSNWNTLQPRRPEQLEHTAAVNRPDGQSNWNTLQPSR